MKTINTKYRPRGTKYRPQETKFTPEEKEKEEKKKKKPPGWDIFYIQENDTIVLTILATGFFLFGLFCSPSGAFWASANDSSFLEENYIITSEDSYLYQIDLNQATVPELLILPKIGEATALKIIARRNEKGGFTSPEEIKEVHGIGKKTYQILRPYLIIKN